MLFCLKIHSLDILSLTALSRYVFTPHTRGNFSHWFPLICNLTSLSPLPHVKIRKAFYPHERFSTTIKSGLGYLQLSGQDLVHSFLFLICFLIPSKTLNTFFCASLKYLPINTITSHLTFILFLYRLYTQSTRATFYVVFTGVPLSTTKGRCAHINAPYAERIFFHRCIHFSFLFCFICFMFFLP